MLRKIGLLMVVAFGALVAWNALKSPPAADDPESCKIGFACKAVRSTIACTDIKDVDDIYVMIKQDDRAAGLALLKDRGDQCITIQKDDVYLVTGREILRGNIEIRAQGSPAKFWTYLDVFVRV